MDMRGIFVSCWLMLAMSWIVDAVDLQMLPPVVQVYQTQSLRLTCVVTGEYQPRDHSIHIVHHPPNGRDIENIVTNDETVARSLAQSRQLRYSILKKTSGSGQNQRWEFILTIVKATRADAGKYQCLRLERVARNTQYSSSVTRVFVKDIRPASSVAPQCALSPANPVPGQRTTFSCFSIGEAPKLTLRWSKGSFALPSRSSNSSEKFNVVTFQHTVSERDNNVTFTCTATGLALGYETRTCSVVPFATPTNVTVTSTQKVKEGEAAEFICLASSMPAANSYTWVITKGTRKDIVNHSDGRYVIEQGGALLRINSVTLGDNNSTVQCFAANEMDIEGTSTGTLFTEPVTPSPGPHDGVGTRKGGKGDGNFVFYGNGRSGGAGLTPHPGLITPHNGRQDSDTNGFKADGPNVPLLVGGTTGFVVFMTIIIILLAMVLRSRTKRVNPLTKQDVQRRPISIISLTSAFDIEKADVALVKASTISPSSQSMPRPMSRAMTVRKSICTLPAAPSRKSVINPDINRQQLADKLAATLRTKSYVSLEATPSVRPSDYTRPDGDDCVSRLSTEDSAYDELSCSMSSSMVLGSRSNSNATSQSCYGSMGSLTSSVKYSRAKESLEVIKKPNNIHYAEIDWSSRDPPSGRILEGDEKTLYAQIRKK